MVWCTAGKAVQFQGLVHQAVLVAAVAAVAAVPPAPSKQGCALPPHWRDLWLRAVNLSLLSITADRWDSLGGCVLELERHQTRGRTLILRSPANCFHCLQAQSTHHNILRFR